MKKKQQQQQQQQQKQQEQRCYRLLSAAEKRSDAYKRVAAADRLQLQRRALRSPHNLLQEEHSFDPWRVLVICILLNLTKGTQVRDALPSLFNLCPTAEATTSVATKEIEKVIKSLGMQRRRAKLIKRFTKEYLSHDWTHVTQLCGVGKYAADAYAIFCAGKPESVIPRDHKLVDYWKFLHSRKTTIDKA
uniref:HhH-GPD domain-containing protein n=1 Tax=Ananas comosus var. bracteatus TaxID=296719 RepID=A0A6V7PGR4_ANACO|nr:unnamed protein product [Ananas comosus var. bracteatus]